MLILAVFRPGLIGGQVYSTTHEGKYIKAVLFNCHGLKSKIFEFHWEIIMQHELDVVFITETYLTDKDDNSVFLCRKNYEIFRIDRIAATNLGHRIVGGGVAVLCKRRFRPCSLGSIQGIEGLWIELSQPRKVLLGCFYRPHVSLVTQMTDILTCIREKLAQYDEIVICGDFNLPGINWADLTASVEHKQHEILRDLLLLGLKQHVIFPTFPRSGNTLDLVFSSKNCLVSNPRPLDDVTVSDHVPILFNICVPMDARKDQEVKYVLDFKRMERGPMRVFLQLQDWDFILGLGEQSTVESMWENFKNFIHLFVNEFVPSRRIGCQKRQKLPKPINKLRLKIRKIKRKQQRFYDRDYSAELANAVENYRYALNNYVSCGELRVLRSRDAKLFWRFVDGRIGRDKKTPVLRDFSLPERPVVNDCNVMAEMFNMQYASVFTSDDGTLPPINVRVNELPPHQDFVFRNDVVCSALKRIPVSSANGPDKIQGEILHTFASELAVPLAMIYQKSLSSGRLPRDWKIADVVPVYKNKGDSSQAVNYRPVSLTSHCCKAMEKIIKGWVIEHMGEYAPFSEHQHGFLRGRSTATNLLACLSDWLEGVREKKLVDVVYLDISKAFDTVSHKKLIHKLGSYRLPKIIHDWICEFLVGRKQRVKLGNVYSDWCDVISGVPQGSVLGPLLFLVYINDLPDVVKYCILKIFADDTKMYLPYILPAEAALLQEDLDRVSLWFKTWQLDLSHDKSQVLPICCSGGGVSRDFCPLYFVNESAVVPITDNSTSVRDLGIEITRDLKPHAHVSKISTLARSRLGQIFRGFRSRNQNFLINLYKTFVRPLLESTSVVWNPSFVNDILDLENVQREFTRRLLGEENDYPQRLEICGLKSLEERRLMADLVELFKCVKDLSIIDSGKYLRYENNVGTRHSHDLQLNIPFCRSDLALNSFFPRTIRVWNLLSAVTVNAPSVDSFKTKLNDENLVQYLRCFPTYYWRDSRL
ncbi:MAG: reverse transcriptase family protein [Bacteroidota bacterium]